MAGTIERTLALKIIGDISGLKKTQKGLGSFTRGLTSWGKALAGGVVIGGVERLVGSLGDAWKGYRSGEKAAAQLRKTWKNLGLEGRRYEGVLDKVTASTLRLGTSDDEAVEAFSRSLARTRDYQQSLRELSIAQDLVASGAAGNLESAFRLIQQAGKGSARVVDRFGLTAKTSAGRIRELGDQVKGTAKAKAKLDPLGVLFNRMAEDAESIVGAFAKGDFKGVVKGLQGLGETVADAPFGGKGKDNIRNSKKAGLVNQFGKWGGELAKSIQTEFGKVDWGKTLSDTLNSALKTLTTAGENGTLSTLGTIGAGIAAAIFAVDLFVTAALAVFRAPAMLARGAVGLAVAAAGAVLGLVFRTGMFVLDFIASTAASVFTDLASNALAKTAVAATGATFGAVWRGAMFLTSAFTGAIASLFGAIGASGAVLAAARSMGVALGAAVRAPMLGALGPIGVAIFAGMTIDEFLTSIGWGNSTAIPNRTSDIVRRLNEIRDDRPPEKRGRKTGFAIGTLGAPPGWHWVGEQGPELMRLPAGTRVLDNRASVAATSGSTVNVNVNVNAPVAADGARAGAEIARYLDQWLARGGRFRYRPVGGLT